MKLWSLTICASVLAVAFALTVATPFSRSVAGEASSSSAKSESDKWMAIKLTSAQEIVKHLTSADFEQLEASARRMHVMNFLEKWQREEDFAEQSEYQGQLNAFEFATKELIRHSQDENIDGALKSYVAITESCVHCHSLIRDVDQRE